MPSVSPTIPVRTIKHRRLGFSLTELLVVIGIIVLLVGLLLVALGQVQAKARRTQTESVMNQFMNAATTFQSENGRYPGVIPEVILAADPQITSTENAVLDLMGGFRVLTPTDLPGSAAEVEFNAFDAATPAAAKVGPLTWNTPAGDWQLVVNVARMGEGPMINGKPHAPYFTPGASDLARAGGEPLLPDLIDSWGQPIVYLRQLRDRGPLVGGLATVPAPQFLPGGVLPYVQSTSLGELQQDQTTATNPQRASILNTAPDPDATLAKILGHPAIAGQAKGGMCLISAGKDGIYYSRADGPGSEGSGIDDIVTNAQAEYNNPKVVDDYDDVRVFGGA